MKRIGLLSVAFAAMLTLACGGDRRDSYGNDTAAGTGTAGARGTAGEDVSRGAQNWAEERMEGGMAEVRLGELASQKAQHADVKAFGQRMVQDHTKAGEELKQIAAQSNIQPPVELNDEHGDQQERLSKLQGPEFDREYIDVMVENHENTLEALEDRVDNEGDDATPRYMPKQTDDAFESRLNQWAANAAPTVREHLERARELKETLARRTTDNR